uniref:Endonuclease/exonuclease/phosphatase domain-containing protein n=1 Tax=Neogobius melanostomus TaxID=47308 RepID=A0A8C6SF75_9GOBI
MKIASFNVRKFGRKKASDPNIIRILAKIVSRYDIILILEVVDISGSSIKILVDAINKANRKHHYTLQISSPLGRSRYKEQFMFLYRDDLMNLIGTYQFDDQKTLNEDAFSRDPYILRFKCPTTELQDLVLIPVHTTPTESDNELDKLYDVFMDVKKKWKTDNIMILGDFNADGAYVSKKDMKKIRIRSDTNFHWLISDDEDTTASNKNDHTYDRIVVYGDDMLQAIVPKSAKPFNFQKAYGLSDELALDVSDHYPVEVALKSKTPDDEEEDEEDGGLDEAELLHALVPALSGPVDDEVKELQKGNLLLEREKLNLEIQLLKIKMEKYKGL